MKRFLQKIATAGLVLLLAGLALGAVLFAVTPEFVGSFAEALRLHREQDRITLERLGREVLRAPRGPVQPAGARPPRSGPAVGEK